MAVREAVFLRVRRILHVVYVCLQNTWELILKHTEEVFIHSNTGVTFNT